MAAEYNATVMGRVEVAPGLVSRRIRPDKLPFEFEPSQYVALGLKATEAGQRCTGQAAGRRKNPAMNVE